MDHESVRRYSRQALLPQIGAGGQHSLQEAAVLIIGAGGIGATVIMYLAGAGVGKITVVDHDVVEESNLHRQIIHDITRLGTNKAESAIESIQKFNPLVQAMAVPEKFTALNAVRLVSEHDLVVDATDNVTARYVINDACVFAKKPLFSGSAIGFEGQISVFNSKNGPCYRCLYPTLSSTEACKSCTDSGVLGPVPGVIGNMQAIEVIKYITNCGETLLGRQLYFDALNAEWHSFQMPKKLTTCRVCGSSADITDMVQSEESITQQLGNASSSPVELPNHLQVTTQVCTESVCSCFEMLFGCCVMKCAIFITMMNMQEYAERRKDKAPHILLDVRESLHYELVNLSESHNVPLSTISSEYLPSITALRRSDEIPGL